MSEEKPQGAASTIGGWMKAGIASVISLVSGAVIMYLTPVVNNAIKPPRPVSNFATQVTGLTVNFNNRATGGVQGWWDFGDGSALEPFDPKVENVQHAYPRPGTYNVKLSLANALGEDNERTAAVILDADTPAAGPAFELFNLKPLDPREVAPAVYKLTSKVKNASFCVLCCGDARPMEVIESVANQERYVTFDEAGCYTVRLAAINGRQLVEQAKTIYVGTSGENSPLAKLLVTYDAVKVDRFVKPEWIHVGWHGDTKPTVLPFRKERLADPGCTIVSADLASKDDKNPSVRNVKCEIAPDKSKVVVTGELVRATGPLAPSNAPHWVAELKIGMERRSPKRSINRGEIAMTVDLNTMARLPMQPLGDGYEIVGKKISVQLWDGQRKAWEGSTAVTNAHVTLNNKTCLLTVLPQSDSVVLTITPPGPIQPVGFQRNPLSLPK